MRHLVISTYGSRILLWHTTRKDGSVIADLLDINYILTRI